MAARAGWKSRFYGTLYERADLRLAGYGNPPSDPEYQKDNPGQGSFPLTATVIDDGPEGALVEVQ